MQNVRLCQVPAVFTCPCIIQKMCIAAQKGGRNSGIIDEQFMQTSNLGHLAMWFSRYITLFIQTLRNEEILSFLNFIWNQYVSCNIIISVQ